MNNSAQEALARLESEIRKKFAEIEKICDDHKMDFYWNGMTEYGYDSASYYARNEEGYWYASSRSC